MSPADNRDVIDRLMAKVILNRHTDPDTSYVARLTIKGRAKIAQKLGEEAVETVIAAMGQDRGEIISESADLLFHLAVLLADAGLTFDDVRIELERREGISGLEEKAGRKR
jgi:phosphoribosyl-ATP pyrophosphohydrolase